ncbi:MAG TPA: pyruvate kinase, partial [Gammaproteobacteria bacterium]|nr:pyruvate kinase [Gammaproteobacteria bacterium]
MAIDIDFAPLLHRRTKIIATVGPASDSRQTLGKLIDAGVNIFRLHMSHGDHQSHTQAVYLIREIAEEKNQHIGILADLCGPKIRCGTFAEGQIELVAGEEVVVTTREVIGGPGLIPSAYRQLHQDVEPDTRLLLDDGKLELMVEKINGQDLSCRVLQ